jgi:hypothetical protein
MREQSLQQVCAADHQVAQLAQAIQIEPQMPANPVREPRQLFGQVQQVD